MALATEQLSLLLGQILSVGSRLNSQLIAIGGALASQIAEKAKGGEEAPAAEEAAAGEGAVPEAAAPAAEGGEAAAASAVAQRVRRFRLKVAGCQPVKNLVTDSGNPLTVMGANPF